MADSELHVAIMNVVLSIWIISRISFPASVPEPDPAPAVGTAPEPVPVSESVPAVQSVPVSELGF